MKNYFICILFIITSFSACKKLEGSDTILEESIKEEKKITDYLAANNLSATRHYTGMYYIISNSGGPDMITYFSSTSITAKYTGRILDGNVFSTVTNPTPYPLSSLIPGWQYGIPLIQKGGKIRLFVPSLMAYGQNAQGTIPANSILDFDIDLTDAHN